MEIIAHSASVKTTLLNQDRESKRNDSARAAHLDFNIQMDEILETLRRDLVFQVDSSLIKNLRDFWTAKIAALVELRNPDESVYLSDDEFEEKVQDLCKELTEHSELVRSKTKTLMELFCRRLIATTHQKADP